MQRKSEAMVDVAAYIREAKSKAQSGPERDVVKAAVSLSKTPRYAEAVADRPEYRMFTTGWGSAR
jgi:hypothetical protein